MPLYMDIHTVDADSLSVEDVVKAHMKDLAIQDQFGVTQIKYWVNEDAKTLFCLMKGPDKEACHQVHKQSHGDTACNIIEVSDNEYNLFMGIGIDVNDLAKTETGELDTGYRTILLANIVFFNGDVKSYLKRVYEIIEEYNGVIILEPHHELMVSFIHAHEAIQCADVIKQFINASTNHVEYTIALSSGRPVDEHGDEMFNETKKRVQSLSLLGLSNRIYLDNEVYKLAEKELHSNKNLTRDFKLVNTNELELSLIIAVIWKENLTSSDFTSVGFNAAVGLSKSQAYRKIKSLTGLAPNQLIQESRLQLAIQLMAKKDKTISEIAYDTGFNSPTYFTRVFKKRFGTSPTDFTNHLS